MMAEKIHMSVLHPIRKLCPVCGKPIKRVRDESNGKRERYICPRCEQDPLHDPTAQSWAGSPLKPPEA